MQYTEKRGYVNPLQQGYVDLLSTYPFSWFTTLTFRKSTRTFSAINHFHSFIKYIKRLEKVDIGYYMGLEHSKLGTVHIHSLMGGLQNVYRSKWWKWWYTRYGAARIEPYNAELGAAHYVCKYATKQLAWYEVKRLDKLKQ